MSEALEALPTAAGYASSDVLYGIGNSNYTYNEYTVAPFEVRCHRLL